MFCDLADEAVRSLALGHVWTRGADRVVVCSVCGVAAEDWWRTQGYTVEQFRLHAALGDQWVVERSAPTSQPPEHWAGRQQWGESDDAAAERQLIPMRRFPVRGYQQSAVIWSRAEGARD